MGTPSTTPYARPTVTFWGSAQSVTGSMHLVEGAGRKVLLDCGAVRRRHAEPELPGGHFPFVPEQLDAVVLSHAHMDHCGNLPNLVRTGFTGPIYCTPATRDLVALMLSDSTRFHEHDPFVQNVLGVPDVPGRPHYTRQDVERAIQQCVVLPYGAAREIAPDIQVRLVNAGHILGSAMVAVIVCRGGRESRLTFTGDLGRPGSPLLRAPDPVPAADLLISESTYGARLLDSAAGAAEALAVVVRRCVAEGGKVLIPAFSLGRTQLVVHYLRAGMRAGSLPEVPIFVDSPLAAKIAGVYLQHPECLHEEYAERASPAPDVMVPAGGPLAGPADPAAGGAVTYLRTPEESATLSGRRHPCVIIAPDGMCEGGRIVRHIKEHIDDPRCSIVLVSYQAPHTLGRRLREPRPRIRIHGKDWNRWAEVVELSGFSGHPDRKELLALLSPLAASGPAVRLVHGEPEQAAALAHALRGAGFANVEVPARGETAAFG